MDARVASFLLFAAVGLVGCSDETSARDLFSGTYTCPHERITVTTRKDLVARDLTYRPKTPPASIAADPGRLALWKEEEARRAAKYDGKSVVHARGCDREVFYICGQLYSSGGSRHGCMAADFPPEK